MIAVKCPVPAPLAPFVTSLGYYEGEFAHALERALPTGQPQLLINLHDDKLRVYDEDGTATTTVGGAALQGVPAGPVVIDVADQRATICVSFRPGGAHPFFTTPASAIGSELVDLADLWGHDSATELRERLLYTDTPEAKLHLVATTLLRQVVHPLAPDPAVRLAVAALTDGAQVGSVIDRLGFTPKRFIRCFTDQVGLTPKRFSRVRRFQRALASVPYDRPPDWAEIAVACGYYDQAHLIHEFHELSGDSPGQYRPRSRNEPNHVPLSR